VSMGPVYSEMGIQLLTAIPPILLTLASESAVRILIEYAGLPSMRGYENTDAKPTKLRRSNGEATINAITRDRFVIS
jgi:hypothetical protein